MSTPLRVLLAEDNEEDARLLLRELRNGGYEVTSERVETPQGFRDALVNRPWDLILSDYSFPRFSGTEALRIHKEIGLDLPFIFVSGAIGEDVAVEAMKSGAHDYVMKNNLARLCPAVERELRDTLERRAARQAEENMRISENKYRHLFESLSDAAFVLCEESGRIIDTNARAEILLGCTRSEILGSEQSKVFAFKDPAGFSSLRTVADGPPTGICELEVSRHDGTRVPANASASRIELYGRRLLLMLVRDISEREKMLDQLRQLSSAVEQSPACIVITDPTGAITYVNSKFTQVTGFSPQEVTGQTPRILKSGETPPETHQQLWKTITSGKEWRGEFHDKKKNGDLFWASAAISPMMDSEGTITHFLGEIEDVSEKKELEAQFLRTQRLESIGQLAGGIAHDLNNILTPILLGVELLREEIQTQNGHSMLSTIEASAARGANLVKQILTFARGTGRQHGLLQPSHLVKEMVKIIQETFPKSILVKSDTSNCHWMISGDVTQLHQILLNLTVNARDAMPEGGTLGMELEDVLIDEPTANSTPEAKPGPYVRLRVSDTGTGIPPAMMEKIFDPFFTSKDPEKGTGLGLSTVLGIVKSHGGFIQVNSEVGHGTVFTVYLPAINESPLQEANPSKMAPPQGSGELILVIDDEQAIRSITKNILEENGYRTLTASNGLEAIALYSEQASQIDLIAADLSMPFINGLDTLEMLRKHNPNLRAILLTGQEVALEDGKRTGVAVLKKPFDTGSLLEAIRGALAAN